MNIKYILKRLLYAIPAILLVIIVFFRNGLFGTKELSWSAIGKRLRKMSGHGEVKG